MISEVEQMIMAVEVRLMPEVECESLVAGEREMAGEEEWREEEPVSSTRR